MIQKNRLTADYLRSLPDEDVRAALSKLTTKQLEELKFDYSFLARDNQLPPSGDWNVWFLNCGRGFGKTWTGVQWVRDQVKRGHKRIAAVASTNSDIERVMVKGESGFLSLCSKHDKTNKGKPLGFPEWSPTKRTLTWENGAKVEFYSAEEPERLRGPQFSAAWCFTKGHKVETKFGELPVERVKVGTEVYTSNGLEKVSHTSIRNMPVGKVVFSDGTALEGTYDHPIYTQRGWVPLGELKVSDVCVKLITMATFGVSTHKDTTIQKVKELFTGTLLKSFTETSLDSTSTTLTGTNLITNQATYNPSQGKNIYDCTTANEVQSHVNQKGCESSIVTGAARLLNVSKSLVKGSIAKVASIVGLKRKERNLQYAVSAEKLFTPEWELCVVSVASTWQPTGVKPVYNLHVENTHEYFCNGILTHNCDELAAWNKDQETWDMLQFCLRLGRHPRVCVTTTPKSTVLVRSLLKDAKTYVTTGSTFDNSTNLADTYLQAVKDQYEGTRLGRQELYAEVLTENEGALWTADMIDACQVSRDDLPTFVRKVVSVDPAITANVESDLTGIIVAGIDEEGIGYILGDYSFKGLPEAWATRAIELYHEHECSRVVYESNQGKDLIPTLFRTIDPNIPLKGVHASTAKIARAEPVSSLYERGKVKHVRNPEDPVASLSQLETQMTTYEPMGKQKSPDRYDAMVWALTELLLKGFSAPKLRLSYSNSSSLSSK